MSGSACLLSPRPFQLPSPPAGYFVVLHHRKCLQAGPHVRSEGLAWCSTCVVEHGGQRRWHVLTCEVPELDFCLRHPGLGRRCLRASAQMGRVLSANLPVKSRKLVESHKMTSQVACSKRKCIGDDLGWLVMRRNLCVCCDRRRGCVRRLALVLLIRRRATQLLARPLWE